MEQTYMYIHCIQLSISFCFIVLIDNKVIANEQQNRAGEGAGPKTAVHQKLGKGIQRHGELIGGSF